MQGVTSGDLRMTTEGNASNHSEEVESTSFHLISEAELTDFIRNKVVKKYSVYENEDLTYRLIINLTWKEGDFCLATTRKQPRNWASLDTLVRHLKKQGVLRSIQIYLHN